VRAVCVCVCVAFVCVCVWNCVCVCSCGLCVFGGCVCGCVCVCDFVRLCVLWYCVGVSVFLFVRVVLYVCYFIGCFLSVSERVCVCVREFVECLCVCNM